LLDEPLSNLDAKLRLEMRTEIRRVCKEFQIVQLSYVTHDSKGGAVDLGPDGDFGKRPHLADWNPAPRFIAARQGKPWRISSVKRTSFREDHRRGGEPDQS
jgi:hypothetical protein